MSGLNEGDGTIVEIFTGRMAAREPENLFVRTSEWDRLSVALKVVEQALREVRHAQTVGAWWYTKGEEGLYQHVAMWLRKGFAAISEARAPPQKRTTAVVEAKQKMNTAEFEP